MNLSLLIYSVLLLHLRFVSTQSGVLSGLDLNVESNRETIRPTTTEDSLITNLEEMDESWMKEAIRDVAYYLRGHKFNEWDRRYYKNETLAPHGFHKAFPRPPLRSLHWEVRMFCEPSFTSCVKYLARKARNAGLKREDDSIYITIQQKWFDTNSSAQVTAVDNQCRKLKKNDNFYGTPFQGPLERLQWRTTASYYMCWFTMKEIVVLRHFNETCDNFADCINPWMGLYNKDPRAVDDQPFACAFFSFCPDVCCSKWTTNDTKSCWEETKDNPCYESNPFGQRFCSLERSKNTDLNDIILNRWNVTCNCLESGTEWSSRFGMCIDVDECLMGLHNCTAHSQECINLVGSFRCVCRWGYVWDNASQTCTESNALRQITYRKQDEGGNSDAKDTETSFFKRIFRLFRGKRKN